jgi:hypothetical protein
LIVSVSDIVPALLQFDIFNTTCDPLSTESSLLSTPLIAETARPFFLKWPNKRDILSGADRQPTFNAAARFAEGKTAKLVKRLTSALVNFAGK